MMKWTNILVVALLCIFITAHAKTSLLSEEEFELDDKNSVLTYDPETLENTQLLEGQVLWGVRRFFRRVKRTVRRTVRRGVSAAKKLSKKVTKTAGKFKNIAKGGYSGVKSGLNAGKKAITSLANKAINELNNVRHKAKVTLVAAPKLK